MEVYLVFAGKHSMLMMGLVAIIGLIIWAEYSRATRKYKMVGTNEAVLLLNRDNTIVLDVREDNETRDGKLKGAKHIPLAKLKARIAELEAFKAQPVLVYCRSGNRSAHACSILTQEGFAAVYNLDGGIGAWEAANLPLSKR